MEKKKSTVVSAIFNKVVLGQFGEYYVHDIIFSNGDKGQYSSKIKDQKYFEPGKESEYTIEEKVNGTYTNHIIKAIQQNAVQAIKPNDLYENKRVALRCTIDLLIAGLIVKEAFATQYKELMAYLNN